MALTESQSFLVTMEFIFSGLGLWSNRSLKKLECSAIITKTTTAGNNLPVFYINATVWDPKKQRLQVKLVLTILYIKQQAMMCLDNSPILYISWGKLSHQGNSNVQYIHYFYLRIVLENYQKLNVLWAMYTLKTGAFLCPWMSNVSLVRKCL